MTNIRERIQEIQETIQSALHRSQRGSHEVRLIAVSKTHPAEIVREVYEAGLHIFGENRIQEAEAKIENLSSLPLEWHLIGPLQTNKVKKAVSLFQMIQSVDRSKLVHALNQEAEKQQKKVPILLQVNIGEEESKSGIQAGELENLIKESKQSPWLDVRGLMAIPPYFDDPERVRPFFRRMRELAEIYRNDLAPQGKHVELSMGMTHDFPIAIEEGATIIRIGTAIFGER